ncbi:hypothetical protein ACWDUM_09920 [Rhodococcus sp. NPDC003322]
MYLAKHSSSGKSWESHRGFVHLGLVHVSESAEYVPRAAASHGREVIQ